MDMSLSKLQETMSDREAWHASPWGGEELDTPYLMNNNKICQRHTAIQQYKQWFQSYREEQALDVAVTIMVAFEMRFSTN